MRVGHGNTQVIYKSKAIGLAKLFKVWLNLLIAMIHSCLAFPKTRS